MGFSPVVRKVQYLLEREGRYYARLVVPQRLRPFLDNKSELRTPLGGDYRDAVKSIHAAVADLQFKIREAEIKAADSGIAPVSTVAFPISDEQMAVRLYRIRLELDTAARQSSHLWASVSIDDAYAQKLQHGYSGQLDDQELLDLVGTAIAYFQSRGNTSVRFGSRDWRKLALALCAAEYEALGRLAERDEGNFGGTPVHPALTEAEPVVPAQPPVSLFGLFEDYIASRRLVGRGDESERRWKPVFEDLRKHLKHDDARRLTKQDVISWRDLLLKTKSPKTVRDVWLASLRTVLNWAVREDRLTENVANNVRQELPKKNASREKGFTDAEASVILAAAWSYERPAKELEATAAAKKWVPWLCAFTGARVTELTQLRKQDVRQDGDHWVIRITPDAGTVKAGGYRDVPLHRQLVELGFTAFVEAAPSGPLFHQNSSPSGALRGARTVSGRISTWLGTLKVVPVGVKPNHGWRHRFKTVGRELQSSDRVLDAICGHVGKTAGDNYGDMTIAAKARVIQSFPGYTVQVA